MNYFTIKYSIAPGAKKTDYLKNPKGYKIRNFFTQKMLIGELPAGEDIVPISKKYNALNSKFFPIQSAYVSDEFGYPRDIVRKTDLIPASHTTGDKKKGSSGIVILGLLAVSAFIFMNKKGKKR